MPERTILLVEDEPIIAMAESLRLRKGGYRVETASTGEAAVERAQAPDPVDLILMDIDLGTGMDGTEAARRILEERDLPIVFLTSHSEREIVERVRGITRYGYVLKNSGDFVLFSSIEMAFDLHEAHRRTEAERRKLRLVTENLSELVWLRDPAGGNMLFVNPAYEELWGRPLSSLYADPQSFLSAVHPEDLGKVSAAQERLRREGTPFDLEYRIVRPDGELRWVHGRTAAIQDAEGATPLILGVAEDITDRKAVSDQALLAQRRLKGIIRILDDFSSPEEAILERLLEEAEEITGSSISYFFNYDAARRLFALQAWSTGALRDCGIRNPPREYRLEDTGLWGEVVRKRRPVIVNDFESGAGDLRRNGFPQGHVTVCRLLSIPVWSRGEIVATIGVGNKKSDYTEEDELQLGLLVASAWRIVEARRSEQALTLSEGRFQSLFGGLPLGLYSSTPEGRFSYVNGAFAELLGYGSPEELTAAADETPIAALLYPDPELRPGVLEAARNAGGSWHRFRARYRRKDGSLLEADQYIKAQRDGDTGAEVFFGALLPEG